MRAVRFMMQKCWCPACKEQGTVFCWFLIVPALAVMFTAIYHIAGR